MHLLLIEDNNTLANLFRAQLRRLKDHSLAVASNKDAALKVFESDVFDLVFIDMALEGIPHCGLEILEEIKAQTPSQRVGILSSNDSPDTVRASREGGAEFYMVKPFTFRGLQIVLGGNQREIASYRPDISEGPIIAL